MATHCRRLSLLLLLVVVVVCVGVVCVAVYRCVSVYPVYRCVLHKPTYLSARACRICAQSKQHSRATLGGRCCRP